MNIKYLLKSQSNQVFSVLNDNGWNPADFEWQDVASTNYGNKVIISMLIHKSSGYFFTFDNYGGHFYSKFSPAAEVEFNTVKFGDFNRQLTGFVDWLNWLRRETEAPDLWGAISQEANLISATSDTDNTPFSADERVYIRSGLNEINQYLLTAHRLDPELVEGHLKYLVESSDRLGRKDWKNLLLATLVSIVMSGVLPAESVREVFMFVGTVLRQILTTSLLLT